jgi:peptidoglycan/LPS O-acetylase OafA/YrhL
VLFALAGLAGIRGRGWLAIGIAASAVGYGGLLAAHPESLDLTWDGGQLRCVAGFFLGIVVHQVIVALAPRVRPRQSAVNAAAVAGFAAIAVVLASSRAGSLDYWFPLASAWTVGAVALTATGPVHAVLASAPLRWLGRVSFSIYLLQFVLLRILSDVGLRLFDPPKMGEVIILSPGTGAILVVAYLALLLAAAEVGFRTIEDPARRAARIKAQAWFAQPVRSQLRSQRSQ